VYQSLLTRKYLTSKVIPLLAVAAVMLCTATVLIVWSIMGGFLTMLLSKGQTLVGDVSITWPNVGFGHYEELQKRLEDDKEFVGGAAPIIEAPAMVELADGRREVVSVRGISVASYAKVVNLETTLWWKPIEQPLRKDVSRRDIRLCDVPLSEVETLRKGYQIYFLLIAEADRSSAEFATAIGDADSAKLKATIDSLNRRALERARANGLSLSGPERNTARPMMPGSAAPMVAKTVPGVIPGIELLGNSQRQTEGYYTIADVGRAKVDGGVGVERRWSGDRTLLLRVFPLDKDGRPTGRDVARPFPVVNEYRTEVFEFDRRTLLVDLESLQSMVGMDATLSATPIKDGPGIIKNADGSESFEPVPTGKIDPARVTTMLVKAQPGVSAEKLQERCVQIYGEFSRQHPDVPEVGTMVASRLIQTWGQRNAQLVGAVQHETILVLVILIIISICVTFLILAIFWAMVAEKTKDIGILRAIGASGPGIAWLWLRYGAIIGVAGAVLGFAVSYGIITNINEIHDWLGSQFGLALWDPKVYYFSTIPSTIEFHRAAVVLAGGVLFSVFGALIPAIRAASMHPVKALRFE